MINTPAKKVYALPLIAFPAIEQTGRSVLEMVTDTGVQTESIILLSGMYPSIAAVAVMDLSVEAEAFGSKVDFSRDEAPRISLPIVSDRESAEKLCIPATASCRTSVQLATSAACSAKITDKPFFSCMIGPFSLAGRLMEMTEIMVSMMLEPETVHIVLEKCTKFLIDYVKALKNTGCNGVIIAEPSAGLLSPDLCMSFSSEYIRRIVGEVQDDYFSVILHNCGNTVPLIPAIIHTGAACYHFGNAVDMARIMPHIPRDIPAMGNIDPAGVLKRGTPASIREAVISLLDKMSSYRNFILSSGCDVPPGTPLANITSFFEAATQFKR